MSEVKIGSGHGFVLSCNKPSITGTIVDWDPFSYMASLGHSDLIMLI